MLAIALPMMLLVFGEIPIASWLVGRYVGPRWQSRVFALQYVLSLGVSAAVVPLMFDPATAEFRPVGSMTSSGD